MSNPRNNPWFIDPWRFIKEQRTIDKQLGSEVFERLAGSVHGLTAPIDIHLIAHQDSYQNDILEGVIKTSVTQICQRCLEPFEMPLSANFKWIPVHSEEEADALGDDSLVIDGEGLDLLKAFEDELILNLPIIASHPDSVNCKGRDVLMAYSKIEEPHPFAVLGGLLKKN